MYTPVDKSTISLLYLVTTVNLNNTYYVYLCKHTITEHVSEIMITFVPQKHTDK